MCDKLTEAQRQPEQEDDLMLDKIEVGKTYFFENNPTETRTVLFLTDISVFYQDQKGNERVISKSGAKEYWTTPKRTGELWMVFYKSEDRVCSVTFRDKKDAESFVKNFKESVLASKHVKWVEGESL